MLKRNIQFTPETKGFTDGIKRQREYSSPLVNRTPLRNASASLETLTPQKSQLNDDDLERRKSRALLHENRKNIKNSILSPVIARSPKALPINISKGSPMADSDHNVVEATGRAIPGVSQRTKRVSYLSKNYQSAGSVLSNLIAKSAALNNLNINTSNTNVTSSNDLSMEQRNRVFEDWMRIAADNKINAKNSWSVALIDYFGELTFLRDGDSINFQKASCTLDGCVKVYSNRVDSVVDETGRLISGLGYDENTDPAPSKLSTKKSTRSSTLEKNEESITLQQFSLEFSADPLFRKMSAQFDEGGTKGLLTNNLALSDSGRLLFDSHGAPPLLKYIGDEMEIDYLLIDTESFDKRHSAEIASLVNRKIAPSMEEFYGLINTSLSSDKRIIDKKLAEAIARMEKFTPEIVSYTDLIEDSDEDEMKSSSLISNRVLLDHVVDRESIEADSATLFENHDSFFPNFDDDNVPEELDVGNLRNGPIRLENHLTEHLVETATQTFSLYNDEHEKNETVQGNRIRLMSALIDDDDEFCLIADVEARIQRNWAGPGHWRIQQRPHLRRIRPNESNSQAAKTNNELSPSVLPTLRIKGTKKDNSLNFTPLDNQLISNFECLDLNNIFPRGTFSSLTFSQSHLADRASCDHLLPEDLHFNSSRLLHLFTNPRWRIRRRKAVSRIFDMSNIHEIENYNGFADEDVVQNDIFDDNPDAYTAEYETTKYDEISAEQQPNDNNISPTNFIKRDDLAPLQLRPEFWAEQRSEAVISKSAKSKIKMSEVDDYGRNLVLTVMGTTSNLIGNFSDGIVHAKRVDVHALKTQMREIIQSNHCTVSDSLRLSDIVKHLRDQGNTASLPYYFICLLHLTNDHGLQLSKDPSFTHDESIRISLQGALF